MGDSLGLWWKLVTSHVVVDMDVILIVVSSSCELGPLLASGAWFGSIWIWGNCVGGGSIEGPITGMSIQTVGRSIHSSYWYLGRWVPLGSRGSSGISGGANPIVVVSQIAGSGSANPIVVIYRMAGTCKEALWDAGHG